MQNRHEMQICGSVMTALDDTCFSFNVCDTNFWLYSVIDLAFEVRWLIQYDVDAHDLIITISYTLMPEQIGGHFVMLF